MAKPKARQYLQRYGQEDIRLDAFAIKKMGLQQSETTLKIDNFIIICAPFQVSMSKAVLFVILRKEELPFFQHYTLKLAVLKFTFQKKNIPLKFFVYVKINKLIPLKGRQDMAMIDVSYKNCPEDLIITLGDYLSEMESIRQYYNKFKSKQILINNDNARKLRFNNYVECIIGERKIESRLLNMTVELLTLVVPGIDPNLKVGSEIGAKLYFQIYRFTVKGTVVKLASGSGGFVKLIMRIPFSPELADIVRDFFSDDHLVSIPQTS
ncbi:MAG: hypothetical protein JXR70_06665 [Spirochaetales bacterium]|nr:hypothetical protein [Spirochaetales bacterium]